VARERATPRSSPYQIALSPAEDQELRRRAASYTLPYYVVQRAQMILHAAEGWRNDQIAEYLHMRREIVSKWRKRFFEQQLPGLEEHPRPGRPRAFSPGGSRSGEGDRM
jgi:hypothetical protein